MHDKCRVHCLSKYTKAILPVSLNSLPTMCAVFSVRWDYYYQILIPSQAGQFKMSHISFKIVINKDSIVGGHCSLWFAKSLFIIASSPWHVFSSENSLTKQFRLAHIIIDLVICNTKKALNARERRGNSVFRGKLN